MQAFAGGKIYNIPLKLSAVCGTLRLLSHARPSGLLTGGYVALPLATPKFAFGKLCMPALPEPYAVEDINFG